MLANRGLGADIHLHDQQSTESHAQMGTCNQMHRHAFVFVHRQAHKDMTAKYMHKSTRCTDMHTHTHRHTHMYEHMIALAGTHMHAR